MNPGNWSFNLLLRARPTERSHMVNAPRSTAGIRGQRTKMFWRMETSSGRVITCALYRMPNGFELRAGEGEEDRWLAQRVSTVWAAEVFAATWKIAAQTNGVRGPVIGRSAVDLAGPSEQVQQMEDPPFVCPSCLSSRGRVQHVTTPPIRCCLACAVMFVAIRGPWPGSPVSSPQPWWAIAQPVFELARTTDMPQLRS